LPPIQTDPSAEERRFACGIEAPVTFMQRVSFWIGRKKAATVRAIEDEMPGGLTTDSSTHLV
jgi:hypothetical protein